MYRSLNYFKMVCLIGIAPTRDFSHYPLKIARLLVTPQTHENYIVCEFTALTLTPAA
jgi:hypothetical protein